MPNVNGIVEAISKYNSIMVDSVPDTWFSCYRKEQLDGVNKGDTVAFEYVEKAKGSKTYYNVKGSVNVVDGTGEAETHAVSRPRGGFAPAPTNAFPVPALDRSRPIIRQNALSHATNVVMGLYGGRKEASDTPQVMAEEIVRIARYFESYSDGSMDVEGVEEEAEDIISKLMAKKESKSGTETPA